MLLAAGMRKVAGDPEGPSTQSCHGLYPRLRSLHIRHARRDAPDASVRRPVHVLHYRVVQPGLIEIVRVLHERMEPSRHIGKD